MTGRVAILVVVAAIAVFCVYVLRAFSRHTIVAGDVVYDDTGSSSTPPATLISWKYHLAGRPDLVVKRWWGALNPVEIKSAEMPRRGPPDSHVLQVVAYAVLVEATFGRKVRWAAINYRRATSWVRVSRRRRRALVQVIDAIVGARWTGVAGRSHSQPSRCTSCLYRDTCDEALD